MKRYLWLLSLFVLIFAIDFFSKAYVHSHIPFMNWASPFYPYGGVPVFHNWMGIDFSINHVVNKGAAWGMLASWQNALLYVRFLVIGCIIAYFLFSPSAKSKQIPLVLIISGAMGNVLDYFLYGHVIDMFHFKFWDYTYPVFNVADAAIFCGITWLFLKSSKSKRDEPISTN